MPNTDANGQVIFNDVPVGQYTVRHTPAQGFSDPPDQAVQVSAGATLDVNFVSDPLVGNVRVTVRKSDGTPVPGAQVDLEVIIP